MEVELHHPQSLQKVVRLADRYDSIVYRQAHIASQQPFKSSYQEYVRGEPMQLDVLHTTQNSNTTDSIQVDALKTKALSLKLKKFSDKERAYLRSINTCFKCRKLGHMVRECPSQSNNTKSGNQNTSRLECLYWFSSTRNGTYLNPNYIRNKESRYNRNYDT